LIAALVNVSVDVLPGVPATRNWIEAKAPEPLRGLPVAYVVM
jgi:hypothetical protein